MSLVVIAQRSFLPDCYEILLKLNWLNLEMGINPFIRLSFMRFLSSRKNIHSNQAGKLLGLTKSFPFPVYQDNCCFEQDY